MERLHVNLIQDKIVVIESYVEKVLKEIATQKDIIPYKNPHYVNAKDYYLDFKEDKLVVTNHESDIIDQVLYSEIEHVIISMCSRWPGIRYNRYQVDLDIKLLGNAILKFEIFNPKHFIDVIQILEKNNIEIIDMASVVKLFKQYPNYDELGEYLGKHFNDFAKKYGLDHPRI